MAATKVLTYYHMNYSQSDEGELTKQVTENLSDTAKPLGDEDSDRVLRRIL